jgi:hypothetical protein
MKLRMKLHSSLERFDRHQELVALAHPTGERRTILATWWFWAIIAIILLIVVVILIIFFGGTGTGPQTPPSTTLPVGSNLPSDAECAARVRRHPWEPHPENTAANNKNVYAEGYRMPADALYGYGARVTGDFTGTTDEIIQWASCKWGFDEESVRAVAVKESSWRQSELGDCKGEPTVPETHGCESVGLMQVRGADLPPTHPGTWPYAYESTAFNVDYALAFRRACFEGKEIWFGGSYKAGDKWGCIGRWFSGGWHDRGAEEYISKVKEHMQKKVWNDYGVGLVDHH